MIGKDFSIIVSKSSLNCVCVCWKWSDQTKFKPEVEITLKNDQEFLGNNNQAYPTTMSAMIEWETMKMKDDFFQRDRLIESTPKTTTTTTKYSVSC